MKKDKTRAIVKRKARLVVRMFVLQEGVDFGDDFARVARTDSSTAS